MNGPLLEVDSLSHVFPNGKEGLRDVSLTFERGGLTILAGANGSGKTLLMRHLNGLARPSSGEVRLDGVPVLKNPAEARRRVGLVFQDADAQIVGQTVARDAAFGPENLKLDRDEIRRRVNSALESTGLVGFDDRQPHSLSGGEKRRLAVAGVLAMEPDILVLDEPFTGLDWPGCARLIDVLENLLDKGRTLILITHDLAKILAHAGRLVVMEDGCVRADGSPAEVLDRVEDFGIRRPSGALRDMTWSRR